MTKVSRFDDADIAIINTCCVTAEAERDCRKMARRALKVSPETRVFLMGCTVSAIDGFSDQLGDRVTNLAGGADDPIEAATAINRLAGAPDSDPQHSTEPASSRTRALIKIQNGCSHGCAYCIVPQARGPERSWSPDKVRRRITALKAQGYREVVVTGVQLGAYGSDLPDRPRLSELVDEIADLFRPGRVRISSIEPWSVDAELIKTIARHDRICPHLHLPLQSGDNGILEQMGREYTAEGYQAVVDEIRSHIPHAAIGTDVLCGFPGEDERAFANTRTVLEQIGPAYVHAFPYSQRPGTPAARLDGALQRSVAKARVLAIREIGKKFTYDYRRHLLGQSREVVIEEQRGGEIRALTDTFVPAVLDRAFGAVGSLVTARLDRLLDDGRLAATCQSP